MYILHGALTNSYTSYLTIKHRHLVVVILPYRANAKAPFNNKTMADGALSEIYKRKTRGNKKDTQIGFKK